MNDQKSKVLHYVIVSQVIAIPISIFTLCLEYYQIEIFHNRYSFFKFETPQDLFVYWFYWWIGWTVLPIITAFWGQETKK